MPSSREVGTCRGLTRQVRGSTATAAEQDLADFGDTVFRMKPAAEGVIHARLVYLGPAKPSIVADDFGADE